MFRRQELPNELLAILELDDGAGLNVREREAFLCQARFARALHQLFEDLAVKIDDCAVRRDGSRAHVFYVGIFLVKEDPLRGLGLRAALRENFDPEVLFVEFAID
jgi:hypothetical protein